MPQGPEESSGDGEVAPRSRRDRRRQQGRRRPQVSSEELEDLRELIRSLQAELRALRRDNELLRRAQFTDPWRCPNPYYPPSAQVASGSHVPSNDLPAPIHTPPRQHASAALAPNREVPTEAAGPTEETMPVDRGLGPHHREPGDTPDGKRPPRVARALEVDRQDDV